MSALLLALKYKYGAEFSVSLELALPLKDKEPEYVELAPEVVEVVHLFDHIEGSISVTRQHVEAAIPFLRPKGEENE